jgi:urocanate hydratase
MAIHVEAMLALKRSGRSLDYGNNIRKQAFGWLRRRVEIPGFVPEYIDHRSAKAKVRFVGSRSPERQPTSAGQMILRWSCFPMTEH